MNKITLNTSAIHLKAAVEYAQVFRKQQLSDIFQNRLHSANMSENNA